MYAFTHEHPRTRLCTIHPCTLTPTLTQNTTRHCISVHTWISLATVCFVFCHRRADFVRIACSERAPKRRSCRLKSRSFLRERRRPTRLQRCPGRSACRWKVVIRTLELLDEIREFLEDSSEMVSSRFTLSRTFSRFAEEMLARLALGSRKAHSEHVTCFSDEKIVRVDAVAPGRSFHTFSQAKQGDVIFRPPFRDTPCENGRLLRRPTFEPLLMTHPSQVGSTTPRTLFAAMLRGPLSQPICRQAIAFCGL